MKLILNTGWNRVANWSWAEERNRDLGGTLRMLAVNVKRFLDFYKDRKDVEMRICVTEDMWKELIEAYPFIKDSTNVQFLDYCKVLDKNGLKKNTDWYDAMRFQILSTVEEDSNSLEYWIDGDAFIRSRNFIDTCFNYKGGIVVDNFSPNIWEDRLDIKKLQKFKKTFSQFGLEITKHDLKGSYINTGNLLGGPSRLVKFLVSKVLELERALNMPYGPKTAVEELIEYVSCTSPSFFCKQYGIVLHRIDFKSICHYTGGRGVPVDISVENIAEILNIKTEEGKQELRDRTWLPTGRDYRVVFYRNLFSEILNSNNLMLEDADVWEKLLATAYRGCYLSKKNKLKLV